jgi:hypothetical protein
MQILVLFVVELFVEFAFVCVVTYYLDPPPSVSLICS